MPLLDDQAAAWRRARRLLPGEADGIQINDVVMLPNFTADGEWTIARVTGGYDFEIPKDIGDYGHFRLVERALELIVDPYDDAVDARLRGGMRNPLPLWNLDSYGPFIDKLLLEGRARALDRVSPKAKKFAATLTSLSNRLWDEMSQNWYAAEFELPCEMFLKSKFGPDKVERTAGRSENGADFICHYEDPLGSPVCSAVQVKMYTGVMDDFHALEQIRAAHDYYKAVAAGIILTTADEESSAFREQREKLEEELRIPVRCVLRNQLMSMFLGAFPAIREQIGDDSVA